MLYSIDRQVYVDHMIHEAEFNRGRAILSPGDYQAIYNALNHLILTGP